MMEEAVSQGVYSPIKMEVNEVQFSHLQFANHIVFVGEWSIDNARSLMSLLQCFEVVSGLKTNLEKTRVFGVGVCVEEAERVARMLGCVAATLSFFYLGLLVGLNMSRISNWDPVVEKVEKRLSGLKVNLLSIGGSLPLYHFSVFRAPTRVVEKIETMRNKFFCGASREGTKMIWARIERLFGSSEVGGLRVGSLRGKNLALLGKWK